MSWSGAIATPRTHTAQHSAAPKVTGAIMRFLSARQTVTIVVTICATVILVPTTVWAAGSSLVRLTDGSGKVAQVDRSGHLFITDGRGHLTVDGSVRATTRAPGTPFDTVNGVPISNGDSTGTVYAGSGNRQKLNLTSFSAANFSSSPMRIDMQVYVANAPGGSCSNIFGPGSFAAAERFSIAVPANDTVTLTYPSPLVLSAYAQPGKTWCVDVSGSGVGSWSANIGASGYVA